MSYTERMALRTRDCDMAGRWRPAALLEAMQETATSHCESISLGRSVTDGLGIAWVLSRCRVELKRLPRLRDELLVETWALPNRHLFFPRAHVFRDGAGREIGGALSYWALMDLESRRIVANPFVAGQLPMEDRPAPVPNPATVRAPGGVAPVIGSLTPGYAEFDLNGHVNNTRYMDWCASALGFEALSRREIAGFDVNYDREVLPGEALRTELTPTAEGCVYCGFHGEQRCFGIRVALRDSEEEMA